MGKYGMIRRDYLREHKKDLYRELEEKDMLESHLEEVEEEAWQKVDDLMGQLLRKNPAPEKKDSMEWVGHMNQIKAQAEEIVLHDLIYN